MKCFDGKGFGENFSKANGKFKKGWIVEIKQMKNWRKDEELENFCFWKAKGGGYERWSRDKKKTRVWKSLVLCRKKKIISLKRYLLTFLVKLHNNPLIFHN